MEAKRVKLRNPKDRSLFRDERFGVLVYKEAAPFFNNPRGVLIHRVRSLYQFTFHGRSWHIVDYWCENGGRSEFIDDDLLFDPGEKLICARCELKAIENKEPSSAQLTGRHVCIGVCRPVNVCPIHRDS